MRRPSVSCSVGDDDDVDSLYRLIARTDAKLPSGHPPVPMCQKAGGHRPALLRPAITPRDAPPSVVHADLHADDDDL